jgi:hypothetical protein
VCCESIGGEQADYLDLTVRGRDRPGSTDFWDAYPPVFTAEVAGGAFHGRLDRSRQPEGRVARRLVGVTE